jgi:hypothetical protein
MVDLGAQGLAMLVEGVEAVPLGQEVFERSRFRLLGGTGRASYDYLRSRGTWVVWPQPALPRLLSTKSQARLFILSCY